MSTDNIIVAIKVRPLIEREKKAKLSVHWNVQGRAIIQLDYNGQPYGEPYCFGMFTYFIIDLLLAYLR